MNLKVSSFSRKSSLNLQGKLLDLNEPLVMGIINLTPDSFFVGSRQQTDQDILAIAKKMLEDGATILDLGAYSTRPGASEVSQEEELERLLPAVKGISHEFPEAIISVDTFRSVVARKAVEVGAHIVNDVSGGNMDDDMFATVAELGVPYILMHMRGTPETMQDLCEYDDDMVQEIMFELQEKIIRLANLGHYEVIIDPGFGFSKTIEQNFELLKRLTEFRWMEKLLLVGMSRKRMIHKSLDITADDALNGTTALNMVALQNGARILRVHDIKEAMEAVKLFKLTYN